MVLDAISLGAEELKHQKMWLRQTAVSTILSTCIVAAVLALSVASPKTGIASPNSGNASLAPGSRLVSTFVEDFTSDTNPAVGGFASSRFVHTTSGNFSFADESDVSAVAPFPSSPHAMFRFSGSDEVTFGLSSGETVSRAKLFINSYYGEAQVTIVGSSDSRSFMFNQGVQAWQSVEVHTTDLGDGGAPIGDISRITLVGFEGLFDN